jgi:hypothetical protein
MASESRCVAPRATPLGSVEAIASWAASVPRKNRNRVATSKTGGMLGMQSMLASMSWRQFNPRL